jgi:outer membrane protein TolC/preprotein translocase subunit SecF
VQISYRSGKPELQFVVKRKEAVSLGLSPREIAATIRTAYNGTEVSRMSLQEEDYAIVAMLEEEDRDDPEKISGLFFINPAGIKIPLENLVDIKNDVGPLSISRKDKSRIIKVTAALSGSRALSRVSDDIRSSIDASSPPPYGIELSFAGSSSEMSSSFRGLLAALFLAVALVYMVMASQFESLLHPLIVMFSVPFSVIGLVAALLVTGTTFNLLAFVGAIMLVGIVVNNAIVLIDYINILRERGLELKEAVITGGRTRLKPILMTSITTILGLLPMALGLGTGAEIRAPMGRAVVGGLITSTAVTLVLIPALYWVIESRLQRARASSGARRKKGKQLAFFALFSCLLLIGPVLSAQEEETGTENSAQDGAGKTAAGGPPLSLEDALSFGLANSETVKIDRHRIKEAEYGLYEARARKFPSLSLQASASYLTSPQDDVVVKEGELGTLPEYIGNDPFNPILLTSIPLPDKDVVFIEGARNTYFQLKATLSQPIFTWGKINGAVDAAAYQQEIAASDLRQSERELKRDIEAAYFGAVFARESALLLAEAKTILEGNVKDRRESFDTGVINYQKVLESESRLAGITRDLRETEGAYRSAEAALEFYTGTETEDAVLTTGFGYQGLELDADLLYKEAIRDSPEVERLSLQIKQAEANLAIREGGHLLKPDFSLDISFDLSGQHIPFSEDGWTDTWNANLIISLGTKVTLFDGLSSVWKIEQAQETLETAGLGLSKLTRGVKLQIRKGIEEIRKADARIAAAEAGLKLSEERYRNARVSYENELITRLEERGAKLAEIQSRLELLMARYEYRTAVSELAYTVNGLPD